MKITFSMHEEIQDIRLTDQNIQDIICCPGGKELEGKSLKGDIKKTLSWRMDMIEEGMTGFVSYKVDEPLGFIEYIPAESAPFPVHAPDDIFLMCYHWVGDGEHLEEERRLISLVIEDVMDRYSGISAFAWNHSTHFPGSLLKTFGFEVIEELKNGSLMWLPFEEDSKKPELLGENYEPKDLSQEGKLVIEQGYSHRCPYSIHHQNRINELVKDIDDERIIYESHAIDSHEDSLKYTIEPLSWEWLYMNAGEVDHFFMSTEELRKEILNFLKELD